MGSVAVACSIERQRLEQSSGVEPSLGTGDRMSSLETDMSETPGEYKIDKSEPQKSSLYPVPRKSRIVIASTEGESITAEELLAIAFQLAGENPQRKLEYWIRLND